MLNREFTPKAPNAVCVSDISYVKVGNIWCYLAVFIDLYSRFVVGWDLSKSLERTSAISAFNKTWWKRKPSNGLLVHSDQYVQFARNDFRNI